VHRPPLLEILSLSKRYGQHVAIDSVSVNVEQGQFVTLLGPSGSGKTTLLMSVAGFTAPDAGRVMLRGVDITPLPPDRRDFGMVFQGYALFPHMSVAENVGFPLRVRKIPGEEAARKVRDILDMVRLGELRDRLPSQLSGGQQQRVALARALVFKPSLLLLDEPLSALDKSLRADVQWELRSLHRQLGMTFLYVTHDQEEALSMSDTIVVMRDGRVEQSGAPSELYRRPATRFVASFLGDSNFFTGKVCADEGRYTSIELAGRKITTTERLDRHAIDGMATLAVRSEFLSIGNSENSGMNSIEGTIVDVKYLGATIHVKVAADGLGTLTASLPASTISTEVKAGARLTLSWSPEACFPVHD
jgi:putative spermidine/putrescine transport system ATP-binding protein